MSDMDLAEVAAEFQIPPERLDGIDLLYSRYETADYEGSAFVLYRHEGELYEVNGSHCSCYGLEGQWEPSRTTVAAIRMRPYLSRDWPGLEDVLARLETIPTTTEGGGVTGGEPRTGRAYRALDAGGEAVSDDAIQDLIDATGMLGVSEERRRAQAQHTASRDVIASLRSSLEGRAAEVAQLQAKVARLEAAIADHVIDGAAADIIAQIRKASGS